MGMSLFLHGPRLRCLLRASPRSLSFLCIYTCIRVTSSTDREPALRCSSSLGCIRGASSVPRVLILQLLFALLRRSGMCPRDPPFPSCLLVLVRLAPLQWPATARYEGIVQFGLLFCLDLYVDLRRLSIDGIK